MVAGRQTGKGMQHMTDRHINGWTRRMLVTVVLAMAFSPPVASAPQNDGDWADTLAVADVEDQALAHGDVDALLAAACMRAKSGITLISDEDPVQVMLTAAIRRSNSRAQKTRVTNALSAWRAGTLAMACGGRSDLQRGVDGVAEFRFSLAPDKPHVAQLAVRAGEPLKLLVMGDVDSRLGLVLRDETARALCEHPPEGRMAKCQSFPQGVGQRHWSLEVSTSGRLKARARLYVK